MQKMSTHSKNLSSKCRIRLKRSEMRGEVIASTSDSRSKLSKFGPMGFICLSYHFVLLWINF